MPSINQLLFGRGITKQEYALQIKRINEIMANNLQKLEHLEKSITQVLGENFDKNKEKNKLSLEIYAYLDAIRAAELELSKITPRDFFEHAITRSEDFFGVHHQQIRFAAINLKTAIKI